MVADGIGTGNLPPHLLISSRAIKIEIQVEAFPTERVVQSYHPTWCAVANLLDIFFIQLAVIVGIHILDIAHISIGHIRGSILLAPYDAVGAPAVDSVYLIFPADVACERDSRIALYPACLEVRDIECRLPFPEANS